MFEAWDVIAREKSQHDDEGVPLTGKDLEGDRTVFLTTREAAALVRLSPRSLERMRSEGNGPKFCKIGGGRSKRGRVVYRRSDLIAWLTETMFSGTSDYRK